MASGFSGMNSRGMASVMPRGGGFGGHMYAPESHDGSGMHPGLQHHYDGHDELDGHHQQDLSELAHMAPGMPYSYPHHGPSPGFQFAPQYRGTQPMGAPLAPAGAMSAPSP